MIVTIECSKKDTCLYLLQLNRYEPAALYRARATAAAGTACLRGNGKTRCRPGRKDMLCISGVAGAADRFTACVSGSMCVMRIRYYYRGAAGVWFDKSSRRQSQPGPTVRALGLRLPSPPHGERQNSFTSVGPRCHV